MRRSRALLILAIMLFFSLGGLCCIINPSPVITLNGDSVVYITATPIPQPDFWYYYYDETCSANCEDQLNDCLGLYTYEECEMEWWMCRESCEYYVYEELGSNFCFNPNEMAQVYFPGCVTHDPGVSAKDYDDRPLVAQITDDDINCAIPGEYSRTYCASGKSAVSCIKIRVVILPDVDPPSLYVNVPSPWKAFIGDQDLSYTASAQDGCMNLPVEVDASYIPTDDNGSFTTAGEYQVIFSAIDSFGNYREGTDQLEVITPYIYFPGPCMIADLVGVDEFGVYLGNYARYCVVSGVMCTENEDCVESGDYCPNEYEYVGPNNGPYTNARDDAFVARLRYWTEEGAHLDPYDLITDFELTPGKCVEESDLDFIHYKLIYACPTTEEYWTCQDAEDVVACELSWVGKWTQPFNRYHIGDGSVSPENCLSRGGGRG